MFGGCRDVVLAAAAQVRQDLKPASMATVEAEFEKQPQRSDWQAARVHRWAVAWGHSMHTAKQLVCSEAVFNTVAARRYQVRHALCVCRC